MSLLLHEEVAVTSEHLDPADIVAYVDRVASRADRARIETHLAGCAECRDEVSDAARIIATMPRRRFSRRSAIISVAGIAAVLLVFLVPRPHRPADDVRHRGAAAVARTQPTIISPVGAVDSVRLFVWSSLPRASRYDLTVFDSTGTVLWKATTIDTVLAAARELSLHPGVSYFWKVEAQTDVDRSVASELVQFSIAKRNPR